MSARPRQADLGNADASSRQPPWPALAAAMVACGSLFAFVMSPRTALFWYAFPLFGLGGTYLVQFRSELPSRWKLILAVSAVVSPVALAFDWPFSGHVLWNVLFIGHAWTTGKRRSAWMVLMLASLLHLFVLKIVSQTLRDVVGGFLSIAVAAVLLLAAKDRERVTRGLDG